MHRENITDEDYRRYFARFDPDLCDPVGWARTATAAGMKYAVITTKHQEGFCLWDSTLTDFKATNTPAGRDMLRHFVEAVRTKGLRVGFYHSLIDWHHPEFPVDALHPAATTPLSKPPTRTGTSRRTATTSAARCATASLEPSTAPVK